MEDKNKKTAEKLAAMDLSRRARDVIDAVGENNLYQTFGSMDTLNEIENCIARNYPLSVKDAVALVIGPDPDKFMHSLYGTHLNTIGKDWNTWEQKDLGVFVRTLGYCTEEGF